MNFDNKKFSIWTWKSPLILHWILNPGVVFNDLILGQRVPKIVLIEKGGRKSLPERTYVPCPHCNTVHSNLKWTPQNNTAFKNWFGLYCDNCEKIIPCVRNLTSLIVVAITFPIWYWFKDKWKQQWLINQKQKFSKPLLLTPPNYDWWYIGFRYAAFMFVTMSFTNFIILKEVFSWRRLLLSAVIWIIGGLAYGLFMKKFGANKIEKQSNIKHT